MQDLYLSLGSNLADREANIRRAAAELKKLPRTQLTKISSLYETSPVGFATPHKFFNCCVKLRTELSSAEVLAACRRIEELIGRPVESERVEYEDRVVDIDVILFGSRSVEDSQLTTPHPRARHRLFVLVPLAEIAPGLVINSRPVEEWIAAVRAADPEQTLAKLSSLQDL